MTDLNNEVKETQEVEETVKKPTRQRAKSTSKAVAKQPTVNTEVTQQPTEPVSVVSESSDNDIEVITLKEETPFTKATDDDIAAEWAEETNNEAEEKNTKPGSSNYTVNTTPTEHKLTTKPDSNQYPILVWTRNPVTLEGLQAQAIDRLNNEEATSNDYNVLDISDQNRINADRFAFSFSCRTGAKWANHLPVGDRKLRSSKTNYQVNNLNDEDSDPIISILMRRLETGTPLLVRLWHSGIVFAINPFDKAERIKMVDRLANAHLETLRRTNGLIHGTSSYYANRIIVEEFTNHIISSNIDRSHWGNVLKIMDHRDIQIMAWAIMASSYQRGYRMVEICGGLMVSLDADKNPIIGENGNPKKTVCGKREESNVDLNLLVQIDDSMFSEWQKEFISRPLDENNLASLEDIEKYQRLGEMHREDIINVAEGVDVIIKAPAASNHIEIGERWITSVEDAVKEVIKVSEYTSDETKDQLINKQLDATMALDVSHWVSGFIVDGKRTANAAVTNKVFRSLSNNEELRNVLFEKIREGMSKRLAAVIAIPTYTCDQCKNLSSAINHNGTMFYTPIDMVSRFFIQTARS